jgi:carboxypeptidase C (cathepsin A)
MKGKPFFAIPFLFFFILHSAFAQTQKPDTGLSVTKHLIVLESGKTLNYTATSGYLMLETEEGKARAKMFFTAYTKDNEADLSKRPVTYTFNGGPGSSSVW